MLMRILSIFMASFIAGCATTYRGKGPDFSLKGEEASRELQKFQVNHSFFSQGTTFYEMGPDHTEYYASSLEPFMNEVSPSFATLRRRAMTWKVVGWIFLAGAAGILLGSTSSGSAASVQIPFYSAVVCSMGSSIYSNSLAGEAAEQYNRDLQQKFTPRVSLSLSY